jgi:putative DNA methylase
MTNEHKPLPAFSWQHRPALIESLFPVQKLSVESFKEQMAGQGKTLTALGSYWKGRKPLILNKACILGSLLPATDNPLRDLEIFEMLMAMDDKSLVMRLGKRLSAVALVAKIPNLEIEKYFEVNDPSGVLPKKSPFNVNDYTTEIEVKGKKVKVTPTLKWKDSVSHSERLGIEVLALPPQTYRERVYDASRPEEVGESVHEHIWKEVNEHLGTNAFSFPELVEQIGIARYGHRPKVADVFSGSGQIPFEAARLGCDVYASDLNPIACMLTWGAFNIVGASAERREEIAEAQKELTQNVQAEIDQLNIESDGNGWRAKAFLYCLEVVCPESDWKVPLIPSLIISQPRTGVMNNVIARLVPVPSEKRYDVEIINFANEKEMEEATNGTVQGGELVHSPDGITTYRVKISTIRGDYTTPDGVNHNKLRLWEKEDFIPRPDDIFQERLYCIQWLRQKENSTRDEYEFRSVAKADLEREEKVIVFIKEHLTEWQDNGYIPDMKIEPGEKTDEPIRTRGWTHWHHLFNPRQLLVASLIRKRLTKYVSTSFLQALNYSAKLTGWDPVSGGGGAIRVVFYNQAINTLYSYACRPYTTLINILLPKYFEYPISIQTSIDNEAAYNLNKKNDLYITDPPYGDAVKYEEITEFFIAWLRKNPPKEFAHWTWDSRRSLAIKGSGEEFRQGMIASYKAMANHMSENGLQVLMFTHKSGSIWGDLANIVWASGLQVTAAWYVVTESDSALRQGSNVTGTIMLVLRKRAERKESFREDIGWAIREAVKKQVESLHGLDQEVRKEHSEGLYTDSDIQMAGYAAALKVLTTFVIIDGKDMEVEANAPKQKGVKTFVDELIDFAVQTAVEFLIPENFGEENWKKLSAVEKYYLKMIDMEAQGEKSLDSFSNFAKAFRVQHVEDLLGSTKANSARLKTSAEFKASSMSTGSEIANTPLRAVLYGIWELQKEVEIEDVLSHLMQNSPNYLQNKNLLAQIADYIARKRDKLKPEKLYEPETKFARILAEGIKNHRL